jgi:hypothetical protein
VKCIPKSENCEDICPVFGSGNPKSTNIIHGICTSNALFSVKGTLDIAARVNQECCKRSLGGTRLGGQRSSNGEEHD